MSFNLNFEFHKNSLSDSFDMVADGMKTEYSICIDSTETCAVTYKVFKNDSEGFHLVFKSAYKNQAKLHAVGAWLDYMRSSKND